MGKKAEKCHRREQTVSAVFKVGPFVCPFHCGIRHVKDQEKNEKRCKKRSVSLKSCPFSVGKFWTAMKQPMKYFQIWN